MITAYFAIVLLAVLPIHAGSHASLKRPASAPPPLPGEEEQEDDAFVSEGLRWSDAIFFPVLAGCMLGSLYLLITYVSKDWINWLLNIYMLLMGFMSNTHAITHLLLCVAPRLKHLPKYSLTAKTDDTQTSADAADKSILNINISVLNVLSGLVSVCISAYYAYSKNWIASNIFGLAFAFNGIQLVALDSFRTGMILLAGLFLYDVYFVFGTEIMVTVAQGIEAPIKIVFPRDILQDFFGPAAMLGLGDIVLPGVYCALSLRYDLYRHHEKNPGLAYKKGQMTFEKTYYRAAMVAYVAGLTLTITALHLFRAAQPALLYLSPACILSTLLTAFYTNDLQHMWSYQEALPEDKDKNVAKQS